MALTCLSARRLPHGEDQKMYWESSLVRRVSAVRWMGCGPIREGGVTPVRMGSMINGLTIVSHSYLIEAATTMAVCSENSVVCSADRNWQIRLLRGYRLHGVRRTATTI